MDIITIVLAIFVIITLLKGVRIVPQQQAWIVERLGKYNKTLNAGLNFIIPYIDSIKSKMSLKEQVLDIEKQEVITKDNVLVKIDAVAYYQITNPKKAFYNIENLEYAIIQTIQTTLRDIVGGMDLDEILQAREKINAQIKDVLQGVADDWGVLIKRTEVKEIEPPMNIVEAMSKLIEADRSKKAMITEAEGKKQAQVLEAEGYKLAKMQEAEAIERIGRAQADAIKSIMVVLGEGELASKYLIGDKLATNFEKVANSENAKIIILPSTVEGLINLIKDKSKSKA
ncbi:MAG: SPFH/Band 7/PHB domain protein [Persephonella sp.]|nr:MAG: SPFH/Band 7/PHB domain protein [Persephonella sp.]RUM59847.1 MAG: SPFH/Band 7/PHB domain protein [Persephonella sp.]